ncbi:MAG: hypothetical protein E7314_02050 [Clostridiales bacterium]|nr:hypothetical protein [Clostridiales bacterium]
MYNIKIAQECNEDEYVAIVATINKLLEKKHSNDKLIVRRLKRTKENVPEWAVLGRQERFRNKF